MRLTKQTSHAIRILIDCARADGRLMKISDIADRLAITRQNGFKIAHLLSRAGFVDAVRGRNGGVRLARAAREIRIGDVVRAMEVTSIEVEGRVRATGANPSGGINRVLDEALDAFVTVLDQHTLEDMAGTAGDGAGEEKSRPKRRSRALLVAP